MRLGAAIGELGRIEELPLGLAYREIHGAIANLPTLQGRGHRLDKGGASVWLERLTGAYDGGELFIGERDRRHGGGFRGGLPAYVIWRP
jgi:hypothetical protein